MYMHIFLTITIVPGGSFFSYSIRVMSAPFPSCTFRMSKRHLLMFADPSREVYILSGSDISATVVVAEATDAKQRLLINMLWMVRRDYSPLSTSSTRFKFNSTRSHIFVGLGRVVDAWVKLIRYIHFICSSMYLMILDPSMSWRGWGTCLGWAHCV
jgi:hypothetical protein